MSGKADACLIGGRGGGARYEGRGGSVFLGCVVIGVCVSVRVGRGVTRATINLVEKGGKTSEKGS